MSEAKPAKFDKDKDHLNKTYLEELGLKIWATKGARFGASKRLLVKADLSNKSIGFLSAYLIIFGLLSVYGSTTDYGISSNVIAFGSTAISILLLAFSQMEAAQDYKMKAHFFHECSLALAPIHNEVRIFKTLQNPTEEQIVEFCKKTSEEYQEILNRYPNHDDIDYKTFQIKHRKDQYIKITSWDAFLIEGNYYVQTKLFYHALIVIPPVIIAAILYF